MAVATFTLLGCGNSGPSRASVTGAVTVGGVPVDSGSVAFDPVNGTRGPVTGGQIKEGRYAVEQDKGPFPGSYRVTVLGFRHTGKMIKLPPDSFDPKGAEVPEQVSMVPKVYHENSPLVVEVVGGQNQIDIQIPAP